MRVAIYLRMSTDKQDDSPARQREQILPHCRKKGYVVVREYCDEGERGWDAGRPQFQKLLEDAKKGLFDLIVVDEGSRLSRQDNVEFNYYVAFPLREAKVGVEVVSEGRRYTFQGDNLEEGLVAFINQHKSSQESRTLSRRVITGFERLARQAAIQTGKAPYGYARVYDGDVPRLVPGPPAEVEAVRLIFECYASRDMSLADVCRHLEGRGTPSPAGNKVWRPNTVRNILVDESYLGTYLFNRRRYGRFYQLKAGGVEGADNTQKKSLANPREDWVVRPNAHDPLVGDEVFRAAQAALRGNRRRTTPAPGRGDFLLSKLLVCADCKGWMCGLRGGSRRRPGYVGYRCGRSGNTGCCRLNIVTEEEVLDAVLAALRSQFLSPDVLGRLRDHAREADKLASSDGHASRLRAERDDLARRVKRARNNLAVLEEDMVAEVVRSIRGWEARLAEVDEEIARSGHPNTGADVDLLVAEVERALGRLEDSRMRGDRGALRALLRDVVAWVEVRVEATPSGPKGKRHAYRLAGGRVVLRGGQSLNALADWDGSPKLPPLGCGGEGASFDLFNTGLGGEQANAWACSIFLPGRAAG